LSPINALHSRDPLGINQRIIVYALVDPQK
jgi:hypothetical protein